MKIINLLPIIVLLTSCGGSPNEESTSEDASVAAVEVPVYPEDEQVEVPVYPEDKQAEVPVEAVPEEVPLFVDVDWGKVPVSTADIGAFPYLTAPEGFVILKRGRTGNSDTGFTEFEDFSQMFMFDGASFVQVEGKKAELHFDTVNRSDKWGQFKFDRSVEKYLESIGAIRIFKGQIPNKLLKALNEEDRMTVHQYVQGDPWNKAPVRHYFLNHKNAKVAFQVYSNTATGEVGVIELESFVQTIKAPTASEIKKELDADGKAILHILFDTDKATLKPEGQAVVDEIQTLLETNADLNLSIEGHTDNTGTTERNQQLSIERANAVMYTLAAKGVDIKRLKAAGFGAEKPIVPNSSDENKAQNRRVELVKF